MRELESGRYPESEWTRRATELIAELEKEGGRWIARRVVNFRIS